MQRLSDEWHHGSSQGISHAQSCMDRRYETRRMNQRVVRRWKEREREERADWGRQVSQRERDEKLLTIKQGMTSVASLCLTLSNSLKVLRVLAFGATSAYVQSFAAVVSQRVLLQSLTLHCMSSNYFLILFLPSFLLLILYHFLVLMKYNPGGSKTLDKDVASLFQALRRNKTITGLYVSDGKYGWMFYYTCELLNSLLCDCCSSITNQSGSDISSLFLVIYLFHLFVYRLQHVLTFYL